MKKSNQVITTLFQSQALLQGMLVALKWMDKIDWSWLWVLAPFWMPLATVIVLVFVFVGAVLYKFFQISNYQNN